MTQVKWPVLIMGFLLAASYRYVDHIAWFGVAFVWAIYAACWKK